MFEKELFHLEIQVSEIGLELTSVTLISKTKVVFLSHSINIILF